MAFGAGEQQPAPPAMGLAGNVSVAGGAAATPKPYPETQVATSPLSAAACQRPEPKSSLYEACREEVLSILASHGKDDKIVQVADKLEALFSKVGLLYYQHIAPRQVGWDVLDRHGEGGSPRAAFTLVERITASGWSWDKRSHAICVEATPGDDSLYELIKFQDLPQRRIGAGGEERHHVRQPFRRPHQHGATRLGGQDAFHSAALERR